MIRTCRPCSSSAPRDRARAWPGCDAARRARPSPGRAARRTRRVHRLSPPRARSTCVRRGPGGAEPPQPWSFLAPDDRGLARCDLLLRLVLTDELAQLRRRLGDRLRGGEEAAPPPCPTTGLPAPLPARLLE